MTTQVSYVLIALGVAGGLLYFAEIVYRLYKAVSKRKKL